MTDDNRRGPLRAEELEVLLDHRERRYLVRLVPGKVFHTHTGHVALDDLIGLDEGSWLITSSGHRLLVLRPLLADVVVEMPKSSQVVYPKDLGAILL